MSSVGLLASARPVNDQRWLAGLERCIVDRRRRGVPLRSPGPTSGHVNVEHGTTALTAAARNDMRLPGSTTGPGLAGVELQRGSVDLFYEVLEPTVPGAGTTILLLNGAGFASDMWFADHRSLPDLPPGSDDTGFDVSVAARFTAAGHRVVAIDMRGVGRSGYATDAAHGRIATAALYAEDVAAVLRVAAPELRRLHVVGMSLGHVVGLALAAACPGLVASVSGGGSRACKPPDFFSPLKMHPLPHKALAYAAGTRRVAHGFAKAIGLEPPALLARAFMSSPGLDGLFEAMGVAYGTQMAPEQLAALTGTQVRYFHATQDNSFTSLEEAKEIYAHCPHCEVIEVDEPTRHAVTGALKPPGHMWQFDRPGFFVRLMCEAIASAEKAHRET